MGTEIDYDLSEVGKSLVFEFSPKMKGKKVDIYVEDDYLMSATVGKKYNVKISKTSGIGKEILKALIKNKKVKIIRV
jgi:ATPase